VRSNFGPAALAGGVIHETERWRVEHCLNLKVAMFELGQPLPVDAVDSFAHQTRAAFRGKLTAWSPLIVWSRLVQRRDHMTGSGGLLCAA
jgi:hypothetical protein